MISSVLAAAMLGFVLGIITVWVLFVVMGGATLERISEPADSEEYRL